MAKVESPAVERAKRLIREMHNRTTENGCTEAEAIQAAEQIGKLLELHDLELSEVFIREERCKQIEVYASDDMAQAFVTGIGRLCGLQTYHKSGSSPATFILFGMERDVELGLYLYEILNEAVNEEWSKTVMAGHGFKAASRVSFRLGFGNRAYRRLTEIAEHREKQQSERMKASGCTDLVLVRDGIVREEFAKTGVRLVNGKRPSVRDHGAYWRGDAAAKTVNLNSPLEQDERDALEAERRAM